MAWQKELVSADLLWVLLKRAGVRGEQHGEAWQWAIESPDFLRQINPVEPVWHGASDTPRRHSNRLSLRLRSNTKNRNQTNDQASSPSPAERHSQLNTAAGVLGCR
jgi:hypothetical protein